jgi:acetate kinase
MQKILPDMPGVAVFDTSFHTTIPEKAYTYLLSSEHRELQMRKFGFHGSSFTFVFHGTSVKFVSLKAQELLLERKAAPKNNQTEPSNIIVCHLGSGASVTAVVDGESKDTSMGFTPLGGLMMGARCGSVDPSIVGFACSALDKTVEDVMSGDFNKRSGAGLSGMVEGFDFDMRALLKDNTKTNSPN